MYKKAQQPTVACQRRTAPRSCGTLAVTASIRPGHMKNEMVTWITKWLDRPGRAWWVIPPGPFFELQSWVVKSWAGAMEAKVIVDDIVHAQAPSCAIPVLIREGELHCTRCGVLRGAYAACASGSRS